LFRGWGKFARFRAEVSSTSLSKRLLSSRLVILPGELQPHLEPFGFGPIRSDRDFFVTDLSVRLNVRLIVHNFPRRLPASRILRRPTTRVIASGPKGCLPPACGFYPIGWILPPRQYTPRTNCYEQTPISKSLSSGRHWSIGNFASRNPFRWRPGSPCQNAIRHDQLWTAREERARLGNRSHDVLQSWRSELNAEFQKRNPDPCEVRLVGRLAGLSFLTGRATRCVAHEMRGRSPGVELCATMVMWGNAWGQVHWVSL